MAENHQQGLQATGEDDVGPQAQQASASAASPVHNSKAVQKRHASSPMGAPRSKRRARPPNITISRAVPASGSKHDANNIGDENGRDTGTPGRYNTRSKRHLQNQINDTPTPTVPTSLTTANPAPAAPLPIQLVKPPFCLLDRILRHPEITLRLASIVDVNNLVDLYAISKPFHFIMNSHYTTYIRSSAQIHAPDSAYIFPWRCYRRLTIKDPGFRLNSINVSRDIPSLRWLRMVASRHRAVTQILECMKESGHKFVGRDLDTVRAIKKMWFTMDLPRNGVRIGTIHNTEYWTDQDIFMATFFLVKLDMRLGDPVEGTGETGLRKLMLGQRGLFPLRNLLMGKLDKIQLLQMWVHYDFTPRPQNRHLTALGAPPHLIGRGCLEGWGAGNVRLLRPDELLVRENIRRSMNLHMRYMEMVRWGYKMQSNDKNRPRSGNMTIGESTKNTERLIEMCQAMAKEKKEAAERYMAAQEIREMEREERKGRTSIWLLGKKNAAPAK